MMIIKKITACLPVSEEYKGYYVILEPDKSKLMFFRAYQDARDHYIILKRRGTGLSVVFGNWKQLKKNIWRRGDTTVKF